MNIRVRRTINIWVTCS